MDIALGIRWSVMAGTMEASVVRLFNVWKSFDSQEKMDVL